MPASLTLSLVTIEGIKEGIKFLYGQVTEALKRWREYKDAPTPPAEVPASAPVPAIFDGQLKPPQIHLDAVRALEPELRQACAALTDYDDGLQDLTLDNTALLEQVDALRRMMEAVYQQRLTFQGEPRSPSGRRGARGCRRGGRVCGRGARSPG